MQKIGEHFQRAANKMERERSKSRIKAHARKTIYVGRQLAFDEGSKTISRQNDASPLNNSASK